MGFTLSAAVVCAAVGSIGQVVDAQLPAPAVLVVTMVVLATLAVVDLVHPRVALPMVRRQTPRSLIQRNRLPVALLVWGLDTGTIVSTYRVTGLSWATLLLVLSGAVPWWSGFVFAAGFSLPLLALVNLPLASLSGGEDAAPGHVDVANQVLVERVLAGEPLLHRFAVAAELLAVATLAGAYL